MYPTKTAKYLIGLALITSIGIGSLVYLKPAKAAASNELVCQSSFSVLTSGGCADPSIAGNKALVVFNQYRSSPERNGVTLFRDNTALPVASYIAQQISANPSRGLQFTYNKPVISGTGEPITLKSSFTISASDFMQRASGQAASIESHSLSGLRDAAARVFTKKIVQQAVRDTLRSNASFGTGYLGFDAYCGFSSNCDSDTSSPLILTFGTEQEQDDYLLSQRYAIVLGAGLITAGPVGAAAAGAAAKTFSIRSLGQQRSNTAPAVPKNHPVHRVLSGAVVRVRDNKPTAMRVDSGGRLAEDYAVAYVRQGEGAAYGTIGRVSLLKGTPTKTTRTSFFVNDSAGILQRFSRTKSGDSTTIVTSRGNGAVREVYVRNHLLNVKKSNVDLSINR